MKEIAGMCGINVYDGSLYKLKPFFIDFGILEPDRRVERFSDSLKNEYSVNKHMIDVLLSQHTPLRIWYNERIWKLKMATLLKLRTREGYDEWE